MGLTGIYGIVSPSGRVYIGQSRDVEGRWYNHQHPNGNLKTKLYSSLKCYGWQSHSFELLHELPADVPQNILNVYEHFYFNQYSECGFSMLNMNGDFSAMGKPCLETRKKISDSGRGRKHTEEFKKKVGEFHTGRKRPPETGIKISASLMGRKISLETRAKMSASAKRRGKVQETKNKISGTLKSRAWPTK